MSKTSPGTDVCPVSLAGSLDHFIRRWLQDPLKILSPYIRPGMTLLDAGCGPGFFTLPMAKLAGPAGRVIAADLQKGMLDIIARKIRNTPLQERIEFHTCSVESVGIRKKFDFILAFYMVHELPNRLRFFCEMAELLNPGGRMLVVEPNFHVTKHDFGDMMEIISMIGMRVTGRPKVFLSRAAVLEV